jgi:hypothetical protein
MGYNSCMTDKEVEDFYNELEEHYGDRLVNFEHHPKQFAHQVNLYRFYKKREEDESSSVQ